MRLNALRQNLVLGRARVGVCRRAGSVKEGALGPHGEKPQRPPCQGRLEGLAVLPCSETGVLLEKRLKPVWWHYILHGVYLAFQNSTFAVRDKDRKPGEVWKWAALPRRPREEPQAWSPRRVPAAGGILAKNERLERLSGLGVLRRVRKQNACGPKATSTRGKGERPEMRASMAFPAESRAKAPLGFKLRRLRQEKQGVAHGTRDAWASDASAGSWRSQCEHTRLSKHFCGARAQIPGVKIWKSHK